jgi:hypothetical protein
VDGVAAERTLGRRYWYSALTLPHDPESTSIGPQLQHIVLLCRMTPAAFM